MIDSAHSSNRSSSRSQPIKSNYGSNRVSRRGVTLIEILIVIAIVALLSAFTYSVYSRSRIEAHRTSLISQAKQIGSAAGIYAADEEFQETTWSLVRKGLLDKALVSSVLDPTSEGLMNAHRGLDDDGIMHSSTNYRDSVVVAGELIPPITRAPLKERAGYGWAVISLRTPGEIGSSGQDAITPEWLAFDGPYLRIGLDGSVRRLPSAYLHEPNRSELDTQWLFTDEKVR